LRLDIHYLPASSPLGPSVQPPPRTWKSSTTTCLFETPFNSTVPSPPWPSLLLIPSHPAHQGPPPFYPPTPRPLGLPSFNPPHPAHGAVPRSSLPSSSGNGLGRFVSDDVMSTDDATSCWWPAACLRLDVHYLRTPSRRDIAAFMPAFYTTTTPVPKPASVGN